MSVVNNYFNRQEGLTLAVSATCEGAFEAFQSGADRVSFKADQIGLERAGKWAEVMHEMLAYSTLCAVVDAEDGVKEGADSLCDRLVTLSVAGVAEISLSGRSRSVVFNALSLCQEINRRERLGLRINCECSYVKHQ